MRGHGARYTVRKVRGHTGHTLNEAADSLAHLGLRYKTRYGVTTVDQLRASAAECAAKRLSDYWDAGPVKPSS